MYIVNNNDNNNNNNNDNDELILHDLHPYAHQYVQVYLFIDFFIDLFRCMMSAKTVLAHRGGTNAPQWVRGGFSHPPTAIPPLNRPAMLDESGRDLAFVTKTLC
jgi:hypothetical protein